MEENRKRRRIHKQPGYQGIPALPDDKQFIQNRCSPNARKIGTRIESTSIDYWIDKHYHIREQLGDDLGKRNGIEQEKVHPLVQECLKHLIFYSSTVKGFHFLNHNSHAGGRMLRIICQQEAEDGEKLNVMIEGHVLGLNEYEITIISAIKKADFQFSDGQYGVELMGQNNSVLLFSSRGSISEISSI